MDKIKVSIKKIITLFENEIRDFEYINNYVTNNSYALKRIPKFIKDSETYLYDDLNKNENKEE